MYQLSQRSTDPKLAPPLMPRSNCRRVIQSLQQLLERASW
jgi:hypothetical protein